MPVNPGFTELGRDHFVRDPSIAGETFSRLQHINTAFNLASGTLQLTAMYLPANAPIGHLAGCTNGTGMTGPTHWWFGLYDSNRVQLATTADQTTATWTLNTYQSLPIATTGAGAGTVFTTTYTGLHYIGFAATWTGTGPSIMGVMQTGIGIISQSPVLCGASSTAQTSPPAFPFTAASITASANPLYGAAGT